MNSPSRTKAPKAHGSMRTCIAKRAIRATQRIGMVGPGKPVCGESLDAEWLSIVKALLG
jgi:hypothetical protein